MQIIDQLLRSPNMATAQTTSKKAKPPGAAHGSANGSVEVCALRSCVAATSALVQKDPSAAYARLPAIVAAFVKTLWAGGALALGWLVDCALVRDQNSVGRVGPWL